LSRIKKLLIFFTKWTLISLLTIILLVIGYFEYKEIPIYDYKLAYKFMKGDQNYTQYENIAQKLGYKKEDKLLIIHADDLGLSNSVNKASLEALKNGSVNSASVMMTCEKIYEISEFSKQNPEIDFGVHLTVTSEWKHYKWDGVLDSSVIPSLINSEGSLYENIKLVTLNAEVKQLKKELQAQIDLAKSLGINISHIDSHEGALFFKKEFFKAYLELADENNLAVFVPDLVTVQFDDNFNQPENLVIIDELYMAENGMNPNDFEDFYVDILNNLKPGLNQILVHLGYDDEEMKKITIDHPNFGSEWRLEDLNVITSKKFKNTLIENNIKLVNWKEIQNIIYPSSL
jgi:chitin disaccharide deacetylase